MENKICTTEENQNQMILKRIHRIRMIVDIVMAAVLAFIALGVYISLTNGGFTDSGILAMSLFLLGVIGLVPLHMSLEDTYRKYRCKACGHIHDLPLSRRDTAAGRAFCPECNKETGMEKVPFHDEKVDAVTNKVKTTLKKPWVIILICVSIIGLLVFCGKPIAISIRNDGYRDVSSGQPEHVISFDVEKGGTRYYLADGSSPFACDVVYLNRESEPLLDALREGRITIDDLNRFGIAYGIIPE